MSFSLMNKRSRQAVVVPELSGGMNLRDSVSMIQDNQLTDAVNVWFKDGVLKTRPGICNMTHFENENWKNTILKPHNVYNIVDGETCRLFTARSDTHIYFFWIGKNSFQELPEIETDCENFFVVQLQKELYCFTSSCVIWRYKYLEENAEAWENPIEEEFYIPTVLINCLPSPNEVNGYNVKNESIMGWGAIQYEGYNLLGNYYKMLYSTYNPDTTLSKEFTDDDGNKATKKYSIMCYPLMEKIEPGKFAGCYVKAVYIDKDGAEHTHKVEIDGTAAMYSEETAQESDHLTMRIYGKSIVFYSTGQACVTEDDFMLNNLEITAPCSNPIENVKKIFDMSRAIWFGGAAEGINGGTRLFLGGNKSEPNLVCWSDLDKPLYFPENNYFYVGESSSPVTAFGKQSDMLVIFKDNETYYTQYHQNTSITAEAVMNQSVIDVAASSAYFPLTLINANIGCDCPDTVELCRNRLVWANSDGRVYTLVSNNQYSERNIFEIGEMIHRKLKNENNLKNARSVDWNGYYLLQSGNRIYVLDYNSYGYQYVSSYSKTEDANLRIPCYYWEFELQAGFLQSTALASVDGSLLLATSGNYGIFKAEFNEEAVYDHVLYSPDTSGNYQEVSAPIKSEMQTKLFEFGTQGYYKNIDKVVLSLGNNGGEPIKVSFVTDMGTEEETITLDSNETKPYSAGYVKSVQLNPCIRQVERFGVRLSCEGPLAVDGITLTYRITGGVR